MDEVNLYAASHAESINNISNAFSMKRLFLLRHYYVALLLNISVKIQTDDRLCSHNLEFTIGKQRVMIMMTEVEREACHGCSENRSGQ